MGGILGRVENDLFIEGRAFFRLKRGFFKGGRGFIRVGR